ncbi:ribosomal protein S18-alanine N-acetyltransferase [Ancylobacter sp. SL191]|uniref:ribosomal protein S18-alanine N-acetyltransferase n=1 Tax=Ancylobacter sp. SL191 TaxID=2995166 RepID=UPI00227122D9|nr:ribosomal protein S18-alanine N-acetyltransferase [Ancylobacter sp. SL191]WAC28243.1 ribosomal protein S18-alanine N-acetyltransferase [Ancylobacter sp. SL191]
MSGGFLDFLGLGRPDASLRTAVPGDAEALAGLHAGAFRIGWDAAEFERLLANRLTRALVATEGEKLIGFILLSGVAPEIEILSVAVSKHRQGRGIGGRLIASAFGTLAAEGFTTVFLEVEEGNAAARQLYMRSGFFEIGRRAGYYRDAAGNPVAALIMRRDIA